MTQDTLRPIDGNGHMPEPDPLHEAILALGSDIEWADHGSNLVGQLMLLMWECDPQLCADATRAILGQSAEFLAENYGTDTLGPLIDRILAPGEAVTP